MLRDNAFELAIAVAILVLLGCIFAWTQIYCVARITIRHAAQPQFAIKPQPPRHPWTPRGMWTLAYGQHEDRTPTHGYEPTREPAMTAFAKIGGGNNAAKHLSL
jgi:hypothetical protein